MKRIYILIIMVISLITTNVYAENIDIKCDKAGDITECNITGHTEYYVSAVDYRYELDDSIEYVDFVVDDSWNGDNENNILLVYTDVNKIDDFNIGTLKLKSDKEITNEDIKAYFLAFYDDEYNEHLLVNEEHTVKKEENSANQKDKNDKSIIIYVMIIIGIVGLIIGGVLIIKKKGVTLK